MEFWGFSRLGFSIAVFKKRLHLRLIVNKASKIKDNVFLLYFGN